MSLIEQIPCIGTSVRSRIDLGPTQLDIHWRAGHVVSGDRAASYRLIEKNRNIRADDASDGGLGVEYADSEFRRRGCWIDRDGIGAGSGERQISVRIDR